MADDGESKIQEGVWVRGDRSVWIGPQAASEPGVNFVGIDAADLPPGARLAFTPQAWKRLVEAVAASQR